MEIFDNDLNAEVIELDTLEFGIWYLDMMDNPDRYIGKTIQFVPTFRERTETISGILPCFKGKVMFRIKRTEEVLNYLRENNQIL